MSAAITRDQALQIARLDAAAVYKNLSRYRISIALEPDGWHVEYDLHLPFVAGGGPHYVIDAITGVILSKKYYQ